MEKNIFRKSVFRVSDHLLFDLKSTEAKIEGFAHPDYQFGNFRFLYNGKN